MLTDKQKADLRKLLGPLIQEALQDGLTPAIQEEIRRMSEDARAADLSYTQRILSNREIGLLGDQGDKGFSIARIGRCLALANNDHERAAAYAKEFYDDDLGDIVFKVLSSGDADQGGVFVPAVLSADFIDALRAKAVVRQAGPVIVDLTGGNLRIPRVATDPSAGWVGEGKDRDASNLRTGALNFAAKTLQGKSAVTMRLLRRSGQNAEQIVRDGLLRVIANAEDTAFLSGAGTENSPRGMLNWAVAANVFDATQAGASATLAEVQDDSIKQLGLLADNNVDLDMAVYFMTSRTKNYMAFKLRDTEDTPVFKAELTAPTPAWNGQRAFFTNNIPNNLGSGTDESKIYLTAMNEAWLAEESGLVVRASTEASFKDEDGNTISAFDLGLMVIIIERDLDFAMAHDVAVSVMEAVKYGA
ncbi:hypothetical protein LCGC14_1590110 [marine sediment metagenome]|uniref:Phage capsid-like C-terminal domain-containing protein n=1 Tax=marine sediment metagenome TaxID=412755 RepID=A0A0F9IE58_9ZZZZ